MSLVLLPSADAKVRIENNSQSTKEALSLLWVDDKGSRKDRRLRSKFLPGKCGVVTLPPQPEGSRQVRLEGDDWSGDNELVCASRRIGHPANPLLRDAAQTSRGKTLLLSLASST